MIAPRPSLSVAVLLLLLLPLLLPTVLLGASTDKPQGHNGLVKPFKPGPPSIRLKKSEVEKLRKGEAVKQQLSSGSGGRGLVIQDVEAPPEVVWGRIMDFPAYTRMVPRVSLCENYRVQENYLQGLKEIFTRMRLTVMGFNVEYFIHHKYFPKLNTVVWTLDYNRESDLDDSVGYWHVIPHPDPDREHWSRVYYSIDMRLKSWMPSFVKNVLKNQVGRAGGTEKREGGRKGERER
ncbi:Polyketide cyclase/dehydrase [Nannochloropsis gaditana]|uniref:Polyketide cyclase/dehydrase n=1 Tax=Nannochloropsis gaditana TaxID=72520 RepID=W7TZT9_9STRA|nr:Polyketide cyclase/dehydrase [Nannochloropsis gaditana]